MRLYEKVPAVTEDLPVELSEEEEEKEEVLPGNYIISDSYFYMQYFIKP